MEIGEAKFLEVRNLGAQPVEVAGKQIDIIHAAQHGFRLEPGGVRLALSVQVLQLGWPVQPGLGGHGQDALQLVKEIILLPIEGEQQAEEVREVAFQPLAKGGPGRRGDDSAEFLFQAGVRRGSVRAVSRSKRGESNIRLVSHLEKHKNDVSPLLDNPQSVCYS